MMIVPVFHRQANGTQQYMGEPDGPMRFIPEFDIEVPTYIDPRIDLKNTYHTANTLKNLDYHVPPYWRGTYRPQDLADYDPEKYYRVDKNGLARCGGITAAGPNCQSLAMNRAGFCTKHGAALHPADKFFSPKRGIIPSEPENLTRLQKVLVGLIPIEELSDEEIAKGLVRNEDGTWSRSSYLDQKLSAKLRKEFFARAERMFKEQAFDMISVMREMAMDTTVEPRDRIQAAQWNIDRILGKTPDVVITHQTDSPYETMMATIMSGSREEYRNSVALSSNEGSNIIEGEVVAADEQEDEEAEGNEEGQAVDETHEHTIPKAKESVCGVELATLDQQVQGDVNERELKSHEIIPPDAHATMVAIAQKKKRIEEAQARIKKERIRREKARRTGSSLENLGFKLDFKEDTRLTEPGTLRMRLIPPIPRKQN